MNWKIFGLLFVGALLFVAGSTGAFAGRFGAQGRSDFDHRVYPHYGYYGDGHAYRWQKHAVPGYHSGWWDHWKYYRFRSPSVEHRYYTYPWYGGPFFGGRFFLPGWGVFFGGYGRW